MKFKFFLLSALFICSELFSQEFIGQDGFSKLTLKKDFTFHFHYWDCGIDSGIYYKKGDTIILISEIKPIRVKQINCNTSDNIIYFDYVTDIIIYDSNGVYVNTIFPLLDTISDSVYLKNIKFDKGQIISFNFGTEQRKVIWNIDTFKCMTIYLDGRQGRRIYFDNYLFLSKGNKLKPLASNKIFHKINGFDVVTMRKSRKTKYKVHLSGFGPIH